MMETILKVGGIYSVTTAVALKRRCSLYLGKSNYIFGNYKYKTKRCNSIKIQYIS